MDSSDPLIIGAAEQGSLRVRDAALADAGSRCGFRSAQFKSPRLAAHPVLAEGPFVLSLGSGTPDRTTFPSGTSIDRSHLRQNRITNLSS